MVFLGAGISSLCPPSCAAFLPSCASESFPFDLDFLEDPPPFSFLFFGDYFCCLPAAALDSKKRRKTSSGGEEKSPHILVIEGGVDYIFCLYLLPCFSWSLGRGLCATYFASYSTCAFPIAF